MNVCPAGPVVLGQRVLDRHDRVGADPVGVDRGHLLGGLRLALEEVGAVLVELGRRDVERERDVAARGEARLADRLDDEVERGPVVLEVGREAALVAHAGGQAALLEHRLERVVRLGPPAQRLGEGRRADRRDHELLHVHVGVGVRAAVENVHHRDREHMRVGPAEVAEQLKSARVGRRACHGHRHADDGIGAEPGLAGRPVKVDQRLVHQPLVVGLVAEQLVLDLLGHRVNGLGDALAAELAAAVPQLNRLERTSGRAARHAGPADGTVVEYDLHLHGRVAPGVEDLPGMHRFNGRQRRLLIPVV